nr:ribonuclease H-like domain-containing protein [Tanacetum cinerariifolium]
MHLSKESHVSRDCWISTALNYPTDPVDPPDSANPPDPADLGVVFPLECNTLEEPMDCPIPRVPLYPSLAKSVWCYNLFLSLDKRQKFLWISSECHDDMVNRPTQRLNLHVSTISPLPKAYNDAFNYPNLKNDMCYEYNALIKNKTWTLMPRPMDANIVHCMRLFRHKYLADGTFSRYKARLVSNGSTQLEGIDVDDTFSLVVKPHTIRIVLKLATSRHWHVHQLDHIIASLHQEFSMKDLGSLNYFLGIFITRDSLRMFLSQCKYDAEILERAHMVNCNPSRTSNDTESKLKDDDHGLQLFSSSTTSLVVYSNADWAGCHTTRRSTSEYHDVAIAVAETCWLWNLLRELNTPLSSVMLVYCDNVSVVYLFINLVQHQYRIPTRFNLDTRGIDLHSTRCPICDVAIEISQHLFVEYPIVVHIWGLPDHPKDLLNLITWSDTVNLDNKIKTCLDMVIQTIMYSSRPRNVDILVDRISYLWRKTFLSLKSGLRTDICTTSSSAGVKHLIPIRLTRYLNLFSDNAMYSASADDIAVQFCLFDIQLTNLSPRN